MRPLLVPGETCASLIDVDRSGVLVDGKDFYRAFYDACCKAERTILMAGWLKSRLRSLSRTSRSDRGR